MPSPGLVRTVEDKKKQENEAEEIPSRGMEQDLSNGPEGDISGTSPNAGQDRQSAGEKSEDEPGYWAGMNPEDSSDTDMNKSRFAVWPSGEKGEETMSSIASKEPEQMARSPQEATDEMAQIGHELHGPDEVILPGEAVKTPGTGEERGQKSAGGLEFTSRVRKGDDGRNPEEWRVASGKSEPVRSHTEDDLKKRQERDL